MSHLRNRKNQAKNQKRMRKNNEILKEFANKAKEEKK